MNQMLDPILGTTDGKTTVSGARWFAGACVVASVIGTSMYTRKRANRGDMPILGVLF